MLQWRLAEVDHRTARVGVEAARELLVRLGAKNIRRRLRRAGWPIDTLGGPHHLGTARMGRSPSDGVVDRNCRVHGICNLFVAGGATFPRSGYAPPTLTMLALAFRLSDHLWST
jgi:choline dehydrogenase-like flavoprotein